MHDFHALWTRHKNDCHATPEVVNPHFTLYYTISLSFCKYASCISLFLNPKLIYLKVEKIGLWARVSSAPEMGRLVTRDEASV